MELFEPLFGSDWIVFGDSFFSAVKFAKALLEKD